jgi:hypothetical protein
LADGFFHRILVVKLSLIKNFALRNLCFGNFFFGKIFDVKKNILMVKKEEKNRKIGKIEKNFDVGK